MDFTVITQKNWYQTTGRHHISNHGFKKNLKLNVATLFDINSYDDFYECFKKAGYRLFGKISLGPEETHTIDENIRNIFRDQPELLEDILKNQRCICNQKTRNFGLIYHPDETGKLYLIGKDCLEHFGYEVLSKCIECGARITKGASWCQRCRPSKFEDLVDELIASYECNMFFLVRQFIQEHPIQQFIEASKTADPLTPRCKKLRLLLIFSKIRSL